MAQGKLSSNCLFQLLSSAALAGLVAILALIYQVYSSGRDDITSKTEQANQLIQISKAETQNALLVEQNRLQSELLTLEAQRVTVEAQTPLSTNNPDFALTATAFSVQATQIEATGRAIATEQMVIAATQTAVSLPRPTSVNVSESVDFGLILVNDEGMSLYLFMKDTQNSGTSTCTDADGCATEWPALTTDGYPVAGEGVDAAMLGTITRDDGRTQVTYNGWPLYMFHEDAAPGDTNGQGLDEFGGLWYLVSPAGEAIKQ